MELRAFCGMQTLTYVQVKTVFFWDGHRPTTLTASEENIRRLMATHRPGDNLSVNYDGELTSNPMTPLYVNGSVSLHPEAEAYLFTLKPADNG